MKKIQIHINDDGVDLATRDAIKEALDQVNGKAAAFTITTSTEVIDVVKRAERHLEQFNVVHSDRAGATVTYRPAGPAANAYKNSAISTEIVLRRAKFGTPLWYLDTVKRVDVYPRSAERLIVRISDGAARNLVKRTLAAFGRTEVPPMEQIKTAA